MNSPYAHENPIMEERQKRSSLLLEPKISSIFNERMPFEENSSLQESENEQKSSEKPKIKNFDFYSVQEL